MKRRSFVLALAAGLLASCLGAMEARATTVTLDSLLSGGSFEVTGNGLDLVFSDFTYVLHFGTKMPSAADVTVTYPQLFTGVAGIRFGGQWTTDPGTSGDVTIGYTVTSKKLGITDIHLGGDPTVQSGDGTISVTERVTDLAGIAVGQKDIFSNVINGIPSSQLNAVLDFATQPLQAVLITKDIAVSSFGTTPGLPKMSVIDQTFSGAVPEPTSMALLGIGMAGFFSFRRFFRRTSIA